MYGCSGPRSDHKFRGLSLAPVGQDLFGYSYLVLQTSEMKPQFPGPASDLDFDGGQSTTLHSQVELFVSFAYSELLKTCHGEALPGPD